MDSRISERSPQQFEPLLTSREAAAFLRIHHKTVERNARKKEIPGYFFNRRWFFRLSELDAWLRSAVRQQTASEESDRAISGSRACLQVAAREH